MRSKYLKLLNLDYLDLYNLVRGTDFENYTKVRNAIHEELKLHNITPTYFNVFWSNALKEMQKQFKYKPPYSQCPNALRAAKKREVLKAHFKQLYRKLNNAKPMDK